MGLELVLELVAKVRKRNIVKIQLFEESWIFCFFLINPQLVIVPPKEAKFLCCFFVVEQGLYCKHA